MPKLSEFIGITVGLFLGAIYFALLIYSLSPGARFIDVVSATSSFMGGIAGLCAAYIAWSGLMIWQRQVKAPVKYSELVGYRKLVSEVNDDFLYLINSVELVVGMTSTHDKSNKTRSLGFRELTKNKEKYKPKWKRLKALGKDVTKIFEGNIDYSDEMSLAALSHHLVERFNLYISALESNNENLLDQFKNDVIKHFTSINEKINALENKI